MLPRASACFCNCSSDGGALFETVIWDAVLDELDVGFAGAVAGVDGAVADEVVAAVALF